MMGMTWRSTKVEGKLFYKTERTFVNVNTGEEILASLEYIKENFKIINKTKKVTYIGYTKITSELWEIQPKPTQLKLIV